MRRLMIRATIMVAALGLLGSVTTTGASAATKDRLVLVTAANSPFGKRLAGSTITSNANGRLVSAELNYGRGDYGMLRARADVAAEWERFDLSASGAVWMIKSDANQKFVSAELNYDWKNYAMLRARADVVAEWEKFNLYYSPSRDLYAFKSQANGKFVSAELNYDGDRNGMLRARATEIGPWEWFRLNHL
ncbi:fascin domain-containing protein [Actinomadura litoris]|uniref:Uncharacterized protein n=1 Tax=Actinomadura litoris TaxID=2678616 RepID=A0A7K1LAZ2_9ACTN|nr:hypothetical protein [Actinomadura litoris]MUN41601.1 hypothetical protein [Actinomadura litoris]